MRKTKASVSSKLSRSSGDPLDVFESRIRTSRTCAEMRRACDEFLQSARANSRDSVLPSRPVHIPERGRVRVLGAIGRAKGRVSNEGVALAGAPDERGRWHYTVLMDAEHETRILPENKLLFLGWTIPAPEMYEEPSLTVQVDSKGNGFVSSGKQKKSA